jgi:Txe/YoeB family toxin of toxin-antitoxin system
VSWTVVLSRQAVKDARKFSRAGLKPQTEKLLLLLEHDLFSTSPRFEKLVGNLNGFYSRRINIQHRLVYQLDEKRRVVHMLRMWTHYE